jgi:hypothetical protein
MFNIFERRRWWWWWFRQSGKYEKNNIKAALINIMSCQKLMNSTAKISRSVWEMKIIAGTRQKEYINVWWKIMAKNKSLYIWKRFLIQFVSLIIKLQDILIRRQWCVRKSLGVGICYYLTFIHLLIFHP